VFDTNGNFQRQLIGTGGQLDEPWGIVMAPAGFGSFAGDLLVGNFGNGEINAFNATTGAFVGTVSDSTGKPIVNSGLWALGTRTGAGFDTNAVYFTAGINGEADGLFGRINAVPEPLSVGMAGLGGVLLALFGLRRRLLGAK
ncbi:MAG TPA: TIGR03118 family protein, partial [Candidatus Acidoferrum sp.]|nr:TIGR03118 family protein [Candidatus Acidoferrum sp.]